MKKSRRFIGVTVLIAWMGTAFAPVKSMNISPPVIAFVLTADD